MIDFARPRVARRRPAGARSRAALSGAALGAVLAAAAACGGGGGGAAVVPDPGVPGLNPATGLRFVRESHHGGQASSLRLVSLAWGRLVDLRDAGGTLLHRDLVIGQDVGSDGVDFLLERNAVTGVETLTVLHAEGTPAFEAAFARAESGLTHVLDKGLGAGTLPPYTMVPRNAALVLRFDDLLADGGSPGAPAYPGKVTARTVQVASGYPPTQELELRVLPDPNHGDLVDGRFHSTRVILDFAVSRLEAEAAGVPVAVLGLPEAVIATQPNLVVRIPTQPSVAAVQPEVLENLSGGRLAFSGNGSNDPFSATLDVVRAARSGGAAAGDPHNGFLRDEIPPRVLGAQPVSVALRPDGGALAFRADLTFGTPQCAAAARAGDVVEFLEHTLLVTAGSGPPVAGVVADVALELLVGDPAALAGPLTAVGSHRTAWDPTRGTPPECFVRYSPAPAAPPAAGLGVDTDVVLSFSEPMDPATLQPFSTFELEYGSSPDPENPLRRRVVGVVRPSVDLASFSFEPLHPLKHHGDPGLAPESYRVSLAGGPGGVTDLAGNPLEQGLPAVLFRLDPAQPRVDSGGIALDFSSADEDLNGSPELRGQFFQDVGRGVIEPRAVARFSVGVNLQQPMLQSAFLATLPVVTPLSNHGSKLHTVWRYLDMGFSLLDDDDHNLDVEGLWWEPFDGAPKLDFFPEFEMRLAHCFFLPDEGLNTGQLPNWPQSGLSSTFAANYADPVEDPVTVVHPRASGYLIEPVVTYSEQGRSIAPWPFNRNQPQAAFQYWTWRDTAKLMVGGPGGVGADTLSATQKLGGAASLQGFYQPGEVPSIALPLLMEFRTYKSDVSNAQNGFRLAFALNSSANPFFRTYSTGGVLDSGKVIVVDPDTELVGMGGVNPSTGGKTPPQDLNLYLGQADFVVRVSRLHTIWLDTLSAGSAFGPAVVEPAVQPDGTQLVLAFRGASAMVNTGVGVEPWFGAQNLDPYGDPFDAGQWMRLQLPDHSFTATAWPVPGDPSWVSDPAQLQGARYLQVRVSMIGDPESGLRPELSALGLSYRR